MDQLLGALRAAAEPTRLRLLYLLAHSELTVTELTQILGQSQPRVSRHLKLLCDAGLLDRFREGTWAFYRISEEGTGAALARTVVSMLSDDNENLTRDLARLEAVRSARAKEAARYFDENAAQWDQLRSLHVDEGEVERAMKEALGEAPVDVVVDLGTGTGRVLELLAPIAQRGVGIDLSHEMLSIARANLARDDLQHVHVRHGDVFSLPFPDASADIVTIHQVLHYLDEPSRAVTEAARILKPGGRLLIVDFAPHNLEFLREEHAHRRLGFNEGEVAEWFRAAGLKALGVRNLPPSQRSAHEHDKDGLTVSLWLAANETTAAVPELELTE